MWWWLRGVFSVLRKRVGYGHIPLVGAQWDIVSTEFPISLLFPSSHFCHCHLWKADGNNGKYACLSCGIFYNRAVFLGASLLHSETICSSEATYFLMQDSLTGLQTSGVTLSITYKGERKVLGFPVGKFIRVAITWIAGLPELSRIAQQSYTSQKNCQSHACKLDIPTHY